jgi:predicted N-acetyltransferase YhbS
LQIRSETVADYAAITALNIRAFQQYGPGLIPTYQRQRSSFDPALSLVAEEDGEIVGHVLFTPERMRLMGEDVRIVILSPLAVAPSCQKRGIGAALIEAGHALAREKGYALSVLVGHPTYYPRFGYRQHAYGSSSLHLWSSATTPLLSRPFEERDLPSVMTLWRAQEQNADFALEPRAEMADWLSPNPAVRSLVYERDGQVIGYSRAHGLQGNHPRYFLAQDAEAAQAMAWHLAGEGAMMSLPVHPSAPWADALGGAHGGTFDAAMACPLAASPFDEYEAAVKAGSRAAGRVIWGTAFDVE